MNPTYDLLSEPWIPVVRGGQATELSIKDVLCQAHEIDEISDPLPIMEFGLYRFLVALVMDIYQLSDTNDLEELLTAGRFDEAKLQNYFEKYGHGFDLFDSKQPFLQTANMGSYPDKPISAILPCIPSGTNTTHFHHLNETKFAVSPATAAKLLTTIAPFMTAGGAGLAPSINGAPPWYVLINGVNLFSTICMNCFVGDNASIGVTGTAPPAWRNSTQPKCDGRSTKASLLEALTWRPRLIQLLPSEPGNCSISGRPATMTIRSMKYVRGASCDFGWTDPSVPYKVSSKGPIAMRPQEGKDIWRDTGPLMLLNANRYTSSKGDIQYTRPRLVEQFQQMLNLRQIDRNTALSINVYGMRTDMKMKFFEWQKETLNAPAKMVMNSSFAQFAQESIDKASSVEYAIKKAVKHLARDDGKGNAMAFDTVIDNASRQFWLAVRPYYNEMLRELAGSADTETAKWDIGENWRMHVIIGHTNPPE